ncbi:MAG: site-specific integrase, partial [Planctomycetes bacterium]|nr:site-specific integrase [Planctomycetota bacterium]
PRTIENHRENIKYFFDWLHKKNITLLSELNYRALLDYQLYISRTKSKRTGKYLSNSAQGHRITAVKEYFKYLVKINVILNNPADCRVV